MLVSEFSEFSLQKAGIRSLAGADSWGAYFKLDADVRCVFPFINASVPAARYHDRPLCIQFRFEDLLCTLYPCEAIAAPFAGRDQAIVFFGRLVSFLNALWERRHDLTPDHRRYNPVSVLEILQLLPRTNCRRCGYPTCMAFAAALRQKKAVPGQCPGFSAPIQAQAVYPVYGRDGRLRSTVTIEIDSGQRQDSPQTQANARAAPASGLPPGPGAREASPEPLLPDLPAPLTAREIEVLKLLAQGATNTAISEILAISPHTVKSHVVHIFNKLGVNDRTQAAVWASRHHLL